MSAGTQQGNDVPRSLLALCRAYMRPYRLTLFWAIVGGLIAAAAGGFGVPVILQEMFPVIFQNQPLPDRAQQILLLFLSRESIVHATVWITAAMLPLTVIIRGSASFLNVYLLSKIGLGILEKLRLNVYRKLQDLPLAFHERRQQGDLLSRLMQDTQFLQSGLVQIANDLLIQPFTLLAALGFLIYRASVNEQFFILLVNMVLVGLCVLPIRLIGKRMLAKARKVQAAQGNLASTLQENFSAQHDVRAFELEQQQISTFQHKIRQFIQASIGVVRWQSLLTPSIEFVSAVAMAATLLAGKLGGMNMGDFAALATAMYLCYEPVKKLGAIMNKAKTLRAGLDRINAILAAPEQLPEPAAPQSPDPWQGAVTLQNVSFAYTPQHPVLHNINLQIPPGQIVAIVGPSGAGKTTLINLICRFYDVTQGSLSIDGIDVRHMAKKDLLDHIALVSQFPVLFRGTVAENIRIGNPLASMQDIEAAGRMAAVDSFIHNSPAGYNSMIQESGQGLSGGQRQRVSLARAFLKNAPVLILDEATASLDMNSEAAVQQQIAHLAAGRTTLIIAHRFSAIRIAHRILIMQGGSIVGDGTHEQLMATNPLYQELYRRQQMQAPQDHD